MRSNPSRQHSKVLYCWWVRRRGKTENHKVRSEEKVGSFSSAFILPGRKWEAVTQGGTRGRASIVKGWEDNLGHGYIPDTFT